MHIHLLNNSGTPPEASEALVGGIPFSVGGVVLAVALALCTPLVLYIARRRVVAQPLVAYLAEERRVVASVLAVPGRYVYVHQLRPEHFVDPDLGAIWEFIAAVNFNVAIPETPSDERAAYALLATIETALPTDVVERLAAHLAATGNAKTTVVLDEVLSKNGPVLEREELVNEASKIYNAGVDRGEYAGSARIERSDDPLKPLRRIASRTSPLRTIISVTLLALGGYIAAWIATQEATGAAHWAIAAAIALLTIGSVIWTLVDLETMYVDMASFYAFAGASWASVILAALLQGTLGRALTGFLVVGGIVGFIEVVNQVYRRVRGRNGMGMGDYLLVLATIGVPVGITGSLVLGQTILIVSLLAGIVGWVFTRLTKPGFTRETPYAFGPYLACGWLLGILLWGLGS